MSLLWLTVKRFKAMVINKLIVIIASILLLCGCSGTGTSVAIEFTNNSSHSIALTDRYGCYTGGTLPPGKTKYLSAYNEDSKQYSPNVADFWLMSNIVFIQFDETRKVRTTTERYATEANFEVVYQKRKSAKYTYTFTDADYQFALENGTPLEW